MARLEEWSVISQDPYAPPEWGISLRGKVYGHDRFPDGEPVRTSPIVKAEGRNITTRSGSSYELGEPEASYRAWLKASLGRELDEEQPIRMIGA